MEPRRHARLPEPRGCTFAKELQQALTDKIMPQPSTPVFGDGSVCQVLICSLKTDTCLTHISLGTQGLKGWRKDCHGFPHKPESIIKQMATINRIGTHQGVKSLIKSPAS